MTMKYTLLAAAALTLLTTAASAVDFGGYTRVGPGQKGQAGDQQRCFDGGADGGHGGVGRLGNECNTYGEFFLSQGAEAGGVNYKTLLMTNFYTPGAEAAGIATAVNQIYVEGKGFDVAPNVNFWAGRRFYDRADVHFDDTFFVDLSGTGAGADGIDVGVGTFGLAYFRDYNQVDRVNATLLGIGTNPGGKLNVIGTFTKGVGAGGQSGTGLSLQHNQGGVFGGENTLWLQLANGSAYLNGGSGGATDDSNKKRWRIADSLAWTKGPLTAQTLIQVGEEKTGPAKRTYNSIAGRAAYAFTKNFKLQAELGTSNTKPTSDASTQTVTKFTIAPTLAVGPNYYDRPELRFYVSTFKFNDAYQAAKGLTKSNQTAAGFQAEIWF